MEPATDLLLQSVAPARRKRGRKPRRVLSIDSGGKPVYFSALDIRTEHFESASVLRLNGKFETESLILLRDKAFTAIGRRPRELCLDLRGVVLPLDRHAMETLVTIGRVAGHVQIRYSVILPTTLEATWISAGIHQHIAIQTNVDYLQSPPPRPLPELTAELKPGRPHGVFLSGVK